MGPGPRAPKGNRLGTGKAGRLHGMGDRQVYYWDFDKSAWDSRSHARTFSVGVYQWIPKTSGNELKKSGTIRVLGYISDSAAVYAKAADVLPAA